MQRMNSGEKIWARGVPRTPLGILILNNAS